MTHPSVSRITNRFAVPPWTEASPPWQALDRKLPPDHKARMIDQFVNQLDLSELEAAYRGVGSEPHRPDLMLKVAMYETLEGHLAPGAWARHLHDHLPLQWLALGIQPSRTAWYNFRDRLGYVVDALLADFLGTARPGVTDTFKASKVCSTAAPFEPKPRVIAW